MKPSICVKFIGIGNSGIGIISRLVQIDPQCMDFIAVHTDRQILSASDNPTKIQIEAVPGGRQAVHIDLVMGCWTIDESRSIVTKTLEGADIALIFADMGDFIGVEAAPIIAGIARKMGILTIGVVTEPFEFEDHCPMLQTDKGFAALLTQADSLVVISNERLKYASRQQMTSSNAFEMVGDTLYQVVQTIFSFTKHTSMIQSDFNDVADTMRDGGLVYIGVGRAAGKHGAEAAAKMATSYPLTNTSISEAKRLLVYITGPEHFRMEEMEAAADVVQQAVHPDASFIFAAACDKTSEDEICVTVIASERERIIEDKPLLSAFRNL